MSLKFEIEGTAPTPDAITNEWQRHAAVVTTLKHRARLFKYGVCTLLALVFIAGAIALW
jgi:hypothetical protein